MTPRDRYDQIGQSMKAEASQMFGKPCLKTGGKAFASFYQDCMVFKLSGLARQQAMMLEGSVMFDPSGSGKPMKEWVQVTYAHQTLWDEFAAAARDYVKSAQ